RFVVPPHNCDDDFSFVENRNVVITCPDPEFGDSAMHSDGNYLVLQINKLASARHYGLNASLGHFDFPFRISPVASPKFARQRGNMRMVNSHIATLESLGKSDCGLLTSYYYYIL